MKINSQGMKKQKIKPQKPKKNGFKIKNIEYFSLAVFFISSFIFFITYGKYIFYFQENQRLFVYSADFISEYFSKPGGILELVGTFLNQFYANVYLGAAILSLVLTGVGFLVFKIAKNISVESGLTAALILLPPAILFLLQTHYYHLMEYNLGILIVLLYFFVIISAKKITLKVLILSFLPVFWYVAGAFVAIFLGMIILYFLFFETGTFKIIYSIPAILILAVTYFVFKKILFLQPASQLLLFPLPIINSEFYKYFFAALVGFLMVFPLLGKLKILNRVKNAVGFVAVLFVFVTTLFFTGKYYNKQTARVIEIEKLAFDENWQKAIDFQKNSPSNNLIGEYFFNVALSESDQLCENLFAGAQDFGAGSLILPWSNEYLSWGGYFYYSVGLLNEAHRWAYEELVVYGYRPQNIKILALTNLLNGNFERARKFNALLLNTIFYRKWAKKTDELISNPSELENVPEYSKIKSILPESDFFVDVNNPQNNILKLLESNPQNRKAFEYEMAWLLLSKDVENVVSNLKECKKLGYTQIPRHLEEAALIYYNSTGKMPDLDGLSIRQETINEFENYVNAFKNVRNNSAVAKQNLAKNFGHTFMYYFHFK